MEKSWLLGAAAVVLLAAMVLLSSGQPKGQAQENKSQNASLNKSANPPILPENGSRNASLPANESRTIKLASWNLQIFGESKAQNATLLALYSSIIRQYDVIFVEEIRDSSGTAFPKLCSMLPDYRCLNSSRAGRSPSKEQYGVIYRGVELAGVRDYNPDELDRWERPPLQVVFRVGNYTFAALVEHTKPDDTPREMEALANITANMAGNVVVLGDLNADCGYYPLKKDFGNWTWAIATGTDTTSGNTSCTYDRIIFNQEMAGEYVSSGVFSGNITGGVSDHYLVWSEIRVG